MAYPQNIPHYPEEIISLPMFHPNISTRQQAESYVLDHSQGEGTYIVRPNTDNNPSYVSITASISGNKVCNARVLIEKTSKGYVYYISDKLRFQTINALLSYYCEHRIHCKQGIDNLRLIKPLRKISQQQNMRSHLNSIGEDHRVSGSSSSSDDTFKGIKVQHSEETQYEEPTRSKARAQSESQVPASQAGARRHGYSLHTHRTPQSFGRAGSSQHNSILIRSKSEDLPSMEDFNTSVDYANSNSIKGDPKSQMKCRPPAPLPRHEVQSSDDTFYYTSIPVKKDFYRETYEFLKDNEQCECGLRVCDSELALGWTVHCSHDQSTMNSIFFQRGDTTTWTMPIDLVYQLTPEQVKYIVYLCREGKQPVPLCLRERLDREMGRRSSDNKQYRL